MSSPGSLHRCGDGLRRVTILGSTGSVGQNTVDLLLRNPDGFAVEALTANRNPARLAEQARAWARALPRSATPSLMRSSRRPSPGAVSRPRQGPGGWGKP